MKELLLILILILILAIFFYNCYLPKLIEGNVTTSNKKIMAIGDTLGVGEFMTSQSNGQLFGLFSGKIGIYTIPSNTTLQSLVDNEGLTQEFLTSTAVSEVEVSGANYLKFNTSGIVVTDANSNQLWSIEISGLTGGSTLQLDNNGVLRKTGGGIINIEGGVEQDASGPAKVSVENVLTSLIPNYGGLKDTLHTFYANVDPTALANFRHKYNEIFVSGGDFTELQDWAYYYDLSNTFEDSADAVKLAIKEAVTESNTYGTNSFCTTFANESYLFTPTKTEIEIDVSLYMELLELYNIITLNNPGIQDFIKDHVSNANPEISKNFIHNILKIGDTQAFLSLTGLNKVIKTVYCPPPQPEAASSPETFINMSGNCNYKPFPGNVAFSLL
jgi:hypothetical protein